MQRAAFLSASCPQLSLAKEIHSEFVQSWEDKKFCKCKRIFKYLKKSVNRRGSVH